MRLHPFVCAAILATLMPAAAWADDPNDPTMRSPAARARDREIIRQLNLKQAAMVRERDARYAEGWRAAREHPARLRDHERAMDDYARSRAKYERDMAQWRRDVAACRAGDYSACD